MNHAIQGLFASFALSLVATTTGVGCGTPNGNVDRIGVGPDGPITPRYATVIADGCALDSWQSATLASEDARRVLKEVVLRCFVPRVNGEVGPGDQSAREALQAQVAALRDNGYRVKIAVSFTDETGWRYDGTQTGGLLASETYRKTLVANLAAVVSNADGLELDFQRLPGTARADVSAFVLALSTAIRPSKQLGLFVPPSVAEPSDVPGGAAIDVATLARSVDRMRVMTLDYSERGPVIDSGWAVDALRLAAPLARPVPIDVSLPLYGADFSDGGRRDVSYLEARALAGLHRLEPTRAASGAAQFDYLDASGRAHSLWFDDADSTLQYLRAWAPPVVAADVGVVFYGLGAEDPAVWARLARALP